MNYNIKKFSIRFVFVVLLIFILPNLSSQNAEISREELMDFYETKLDYKQDVYNRTLEFIRENPEAQGIPTLYFNLAELSVEIDREDISQTVHYYLKVLELDPDFPNKDVVLYNIGYFNFLDVVEKRDKARFENLDQVANWPDELRLSEDKVQVSIDAYQELMDGFPHSIYHTEAIYRLGTIYFEIAVDSRNPMQFYPLAIDYFDKVVQKEYDPLYPFGLFQRGWTYFSSGKFEQAIEDFTEIIDILKTDETKQAFFEADAIENIAFSLIEADGTDFIQQSIAAEKAKELLRDFVSKEYAKQVLLKAIDLKLTYSAPMQAIDLYNAYIDLYPLSIDGPTYVDSIIVIYRQYPNRTRDNKDARELIVEQRIRLVETYTPDSEWFLANKNEPIHYQMAVIRDAYEFVEARYHNRFVDNPNYENYQGYKNLVDNYVGFTYFTDEDALAKIEAMRKRIVDNTLHIATLSDNPSLYFTAIKYIDDYNNEYPEHADLVQYQEDIFYCSEQIYSILRETITEEAFVDTVNQIELTNNDLLDTYIEATRNYEELLNSEVYTKPNKNDELIRIIYQRADIFYSREEYDEAYEDFQKLLAYDLTDPLYKTTYAILAEISEMKGNYHQSEQYYRNAIQYADAEERKDFENNILATIRLAADNLMDTEDYHTAAEEYLRLAKELEASSPEQSTSYMVQAINIYKKTGDFDKAQNLYLDIAAKKTELNEVLTAFVGAWSIADSLNNWQESEALRNQFIAQFPSSNEAYNLRLRIISWYEDEPFNDKEKAADMYLALHSDADNIDIGEDRKETLFIKAIELHQELGNENRFIELTDRFANLYPNHESRQELLRNVAVMHNRNKDIDAMLAFEKQYPNLPYSMELLTSVARHYNDNNEQEKFEEIARYIYRKDPSVDLLTDIALDNIREKYSEIQTAFRDKNYDEMRSFITEFRAMDRSYQEDGVSLPLATMYERFDYYENFIDYHNRLERRINSVKNDIINANPNTLVRVNDKTEWRRHLDGGADRIKNLMVLCDRAQQDLISLIQEGAEYELNREQITNVLYLIAHSYDNAHEVLLQQIQLFLNVSTQLNNPFMEENPVQQRTYKDQIRGYGNQKALEFKQKAAQWYQTLLAQYYDEQDYSDEWTDLALDRLVEWGVRAEKEFIPIYSNRSWKTNDQFVSDIRAMQATDWIAPQVIPGITVFEEAHLLSLNPIVSYLPVEYDAEIRPEAIIVDYISSGEVTLTINEMPLVRDPIIVDTLFIQNNPYTHYRITVGRNLQRGLNDLLFKVEPEPTESEQVFAAKITGQFDIKSLELHRQTEEHYLFSDYSWLSKKGSVTVSNLNLDDSWKNAAKGNLSFFKPQMYNMEETKALDIWHPDIDTTQVTTTYFVKELDILADVHEANFLFIGEKVTSIWINGEREIDNYEIVYDTRLNMVDSRALSTTKLRKGKNTIVVRVTGDIKYKGFIFEMTYITDRYERVGMVEKAEDNVERTEESIEQTAEISDEDTIIEVAEADGIVMPENPAVIEEETIVQNYSVTTDLSWLTTITPPEIDIQEVDRNWINVTVAEKDLPNSVANLFSEDNVAISYPFNYTGEDSMTSYYFKKIPVHSEVVQSNLAFATNRNARLFLNGELVEEVNGNEKFTYQENSNMQLKNGDNVLLVELTGPAQETSFICSLTYQVKE